jgi:hypothetical protein
MKCEEVSSLLPDYWAGSLAADAKANVEAHVAVCSACKEDVAMWTRLGSLPSEQPSPALQLRFEEMLAAYREGRDHADSGVQAPRFSLADWLISWWPSKPVVQFALALSCLIVGGAAGHLLTASGGHSQDIARLREELHSTREMVAVSLLRQQSASDRLHGVNWSYRISEPDDDVLGALLTALKYDSAVDVRLAAADALSRYPREPLVRKGLVDALKAEQSPLVQIALIDAVGEIKESSAAPVLARLSDDASVNPAVRKRAGEVRQKF